MGIVRAPKVKAAVAATNTTSAVPAVPVVPIQRKLRVGAVSDPAEAEADRMAAVVMQRVQSIGRDGDYDDPSWVPAHTRLQRANDSSITTAGAPQPERDTVPIGSRIRRSTSLPPVRSSLPPTPPVRRRSSAEIGIGAEGGEVDAESVRTIESKRGSGRPLAGDVQRRMEDGFGADLSAVRVHTDTTADRLNESLHSHAFTTGSDIFFRSGSYDPSSDAGQHLIAHELAHTVQQGAVAHRQADTSIIRRGFFDDIYSTVSGWFAPSKKDPKTEPTTETYPKVVTVGKGSGEKVEVEQQSDVAEAEGIIKNLADNFGIDLSSSGTVEAITKQYSRVMATEVKKLKTSVWKMKELRTLQAAVAHFSAILGPQRADSTLADKAQGVTTIGRVEEAIDRNSPQGKVERGTMGEYFEGSKNVGLFNTVTDLADSRYLPEGKTQKSNATTLEANAIHEMAHGLIQPTELANWISAMDFWTDRYTPSGKVGAEEPPTAYGKTGGAAEDLCESVAIFFTNQPRLKSLAPEREAFLKKLVAGWKPALVEKVLETASTATGTGE